MKELTKWEILKEVFTDVINGFKCMPEYDLFDFIWEGLFTLPFVLIVALQVASLIAYIVIVIKGIINGLR